LKTPCDCACWTADNRGKRRKRFRRSTAVVEELYTSSRQAEELILSTFRRFRENRVDARQWRRQRTTPRVHRSVGQVRAFVSLSSRDSALHAALRTRAHLAAAAALAFFVWRHRALAAGAALHLSAGILRHHCACLTVFALATTAAFATGTVFAATAGLAVGLSVITAGTRLGGIVGGSGSALRALGDQRQSHK